MPDSPELLLVQVQAAMASGTALRVRGGGTKDFYGGPLQGELLETCGWTGIEAYEPSELYVTARAGTALALVERTLQQQGQMLAFEPPHFGAGATVGGCVAAGLAGPRRFASGYATGGVRDHVLGARLLDGRGRLLRFGGTVIKNVAGYDVARLLAGSLGQLGVIIDVTLKVLPMPEAEATLQFEVQEEQALELLCTWRGQPLPISASAWNEGRLCVRLSGAVLALRAAQARLGGEVLQEAAATAFWRGLREQQLPGFQGQSLWRIGVPETAPPLGLQGWQCIEGGGLRWLCSELPATRIRARAAALGGHATPFRRADRAANPFVELAAPLLAIHQRLKQEFDPQRLFNPGRLHQEL